MKTLHKDVPEGYISTKHAAEIAGVSSVTILNWIHKGSLKCLKFGEGPKPWYYVLLKDINKIVADNYAISGNMGNSLDSRRHASTFYRFEKCPFCGCDEIDADKDIHGRIHSFNCTECGCIYEVDEFEEYDVEVQNKMAVDAWNRRLDDKRLLCYNSSTRGVTALRT